MNIETKKLKLAQVRYYDEEHNGVEVPSLKAYVFLLKSGESYINILNPGEDLPVYERVPYTNTTLDGDDYGTKIVLAYGECESGPCYVVENIGMDHIFEVDSISLRQLKEYVMKSNLFFMDRLEIMKHRNVLPIHSKYRSDVKNQRIFQEYLDSCMNRSDYHK